MVAILDSVDTGYRDGLNHPRLEGEGFKIMGSTRSRPEVHCLSGVIPEKTGIRDRLRK
jgi:hypothetical protein